MNLCGGRLVGSMPLPGSNATRKPAVAALQFPAGLRVLVVDDDPTCLKILEKMLLACQYEVTKCDRAEYALNELRRNKNGFDIVLSDVHMPDMDGFKLLEHIGLEMDLPVIMMSADDSKNVVMKGVTHGACDYLIKPVRIEALKNIWQHVVRKKKKKDWKDLEQSGSLDDGDSAQKQEDLEQSGSFDDGNLKSSKRKGDDEDNEDKDDSSSMKKPRVVWSVELHQQFVAAVNQLGIDKAVPKKILEMMNVPGLTRENVASHLQKYRLYLRRLSGVSQHQGGLNASFMSPQDAAFASMSPLGGIDLQTLAFAGQLPGQNISGYQPGLARPGIKPGMSMPFVEQRNLFSFEASKLRFAEGQHLQQLSNNANKQMNLLHGIPTTMELKQLGGFHQSAQPLGSLNMHASSQGSQSNPILVQMVQPQARPGQLMNESSIGSQMSQIQSSNRQTVRPAGTSTGVLPRSGIADSCQATSYGSLDFSVNQPRSSFPLGSPPAVTTSEGLIQEEVSSNGKGPRACGPNYNMFNELPPQKPQDWRSSALSYSVPQHTPSGPKIVDVSPSVLVNQGFSASQRPGQFVNSRAANNTASLPGTGVLQQRSGAQTVNNPLLNNAPSKVKTERDQELSSVNDLYPYQFAQDDLMSAILKQQEGIEPVPGDFDFEGFTMDNIPGVAN